jgi:pimeloyl-ACP methyl ester carboxylesterase
MVMSLRRRAFAIASSLRIACIGPACSLRLARIAAIATAFIGAAPLGGCGQMPIPGYIAPAAAATSAQRGFIHEGIKLAVDEMSRGKPMVLLHGLGATRYTWRHLLPELAKNNHVMAIDMKGFGQSEKPMDERYTIFDQAQIINDYLREHNLRNVTLVGHSFGGGVALAAALADMDSKANRIEKLVLIDSIAYRQPMPLFFQVLRTPVIGEIGMSLVPPEVQISRALAIAYYYPGKMEKETVANYAAPLYSEGGRHALYHTINSLEPDNADALAARYRELKLPVLLLWGEHDRIVPLEYGKKLAGDLPNSRIHFILNSGHIPQEEQPTDTLRSIKQFVQYVHQ